MCDVIQRPGGRLPADPGAQQMERRMAQLVAYTQQANRQMAGMLLDMSRQLTAMGEQLTAVTRQLAEQAQRAPLTTSQRRELTQTIRARATAVAAGCGWTDARRINLIAEAIRRAIRQHISRACGLSIRAMGDVPACQHAVVLDLVAMWDDWRLLDQISKEDSKT